MLVLLSPAKKLDFEAGPDIAATTPVLLKETAQLLKTVQGLTAKDIAKLMSLSSSLASLNHRRFQVFAAKPSAKTQTRPAALAFRGDTYVGLAPDDFDADDFEFAAGHVRILSGLYGLLSPLDGIQPYRLEMGSKVVTERGKNLYEFWGERITHAVNDAARAVKAKAIVNAASTEYFSAVEPRNFVVPTLTPVFKEEKKGGLQIVSFLAKRARGMVARYVVKNRLKQPDKLKDFTEGGYRFREDLSTEAEYVFTRPAK